MDKEQLEQMQQEVVDVRDEMQEIQGNIEHEIEELQEIAGDAEYNSSELDNVIGAFVRVIELLNQSDRIRDKAMDHNIES